MNIRIIAVTLALASPAMAQSKPPIAVRGDVCAPIGRTGDGQLVYSMKCDKLPVVVAPPRAEAAPAPAAPVVEESRGLFRNPFSAMVKPASDEREAGVGPPPSSR